MTNLWKKAIAFTDIHFGNKSNSLQFNQDCVDFVDWVIKEGKEQGCETCLFLGDWHHHRASLSLLHSIIVFKRLTNSTRHLIK